MVDSEGPEIIEYHLVAGATAYAEAGSLVGDDPVTLDIGVAQVTLVPAELVS